GTDLHLHQVFWNNGFGTNDLTASAGAPPAAAGSAVTSLIDAWGAQHWVYISADQHLQHIWWDGAFGTNDITAITGAPLAATGSALTSYFDPSLQDHWLYFGMDQHVHQVYWGNCCGFAANDLTAGAGAPLAAPGSSLTSFVDQALAIPA